MRKMIAKSKLALRRVRNRKHEEKLKKLKSDWMKQNFGIQRECMLLPYNNPDILIKTFPSNLPGFKWTLKPNPNDGTGFSWYEERIE